MTDRPLILHHGGCPDGFTSAWLMDRWLREGTMAIPEVVGCNYNEPMPSVLDRVVYIVDFCFPPPELETLEMFSRVFTILDHHETAEKWVTERWPGLHRGRMPVITGDLRPAVVIDRTHSGAGLTKLYTERDKSFRGDPDWVDHIEDRDLWRFDLPDTPAVFAWVTSFPYTLEAYDEIERQWIADSRACVMAGEAIQRYRAQLVEQIIQDAEYIKIPGLKHLVPCVASPYAVGSDVAGELARHMVEKVGAYYVPKPDGTVRFGLRSTADGPNVAEVAELFGGGGHPHAAGFEIHGANLDVVLEQTLGDYHTGTLKGQPHG